MIFMWANPLRGLLKGVGPENRDFFGPEKATSEASTRLHSRLHPPSQGLRMRLLFLFATYITEKTTIKRWRKLSVKLHLLYRARICKRGSQESVPRNRPSPACVAWQASTTIGFSYRPPRLGIDFWALWKVYKYGLCIASPTGWYVCQRLRGLFPKVRHQMLPCCIYYSLRGLTQQISESCCSVLRVRVGRDMNPGLPCSNHAWRANHVATLHPTLRCNLYLKSTSSLMQKLNIYEVWYSFIYFLRVFISNNILFVIQRSCWHPKWPPHPRPPSPLNSKAGRGSSDNKIYHAAVPSVTELTFPSQRRSDSSMLLPACVVQVLIC